MTTLKFKEKKLAKEKITWVTAYDASQAALVDKSDIDSVLVGDSVAMVVHGFDSTTYATMEMMVMHTQAVSRRLRQKSIIADLPFLSYSGSLDVALANVKRLMDSGAHAVKLEGASLSNLNLIKALSDAGVPVIGHIGLQPQSVHALGGFKVQGRNEEDAKRLLKEAKSLEEAGASALVLECMPSTLAKTITHELSIATIGIGAGPDTDGQVLVWHDLLGVNLGFKPKFLKHYAQLESDVTTALNAYCHEVKHGEYPLESQHTY